MKSQCWICTQLKGCHFNTFFSVNSFTHFSDTMPYLFGGAVRLKWQRFMCINWVRDGIEDTHASVTFGWYLLVIELQLLDFFLQRFLGVLIMWSLGVSPEIFCCLAWVLHLLKISSCRVPWAWRIPYCYNGYWLLWFYPDSQFPVMVSSWWGEGFCSWKAKVVFIGSLLDSSRLVVLLNSQRIKQNLQHDVYPRCF